MSRFDGITKVYPNSFMNQNLKESDNGYFYHIAEIVYTDNFWPDNPLTTRLMVGWSDIDKLIEQLTLVRDLGKVMTQLEGLSCASVEPSIELLEEARDLSTKLKDLNGDELDTPWRERIGVRDTIGDDDEEESSSI